MSLENYTLVVVTSLLIKILGKSVSGFLSYDCIYIYDIYAQLYHQKCPNSNKKISWICQLFLFDFEKSKFVQETILFYHPNTFPVIMWGPTKTLQSNVVQVCDFRPLCKINIKFSLINKLITFSRMEKF